MNDNKEKNFSKKNNKVIAVLPVFNRLQFTKKFLISFQKQTYKNLHLIVVDADSHDNTRSFINKHYPQHTIIHGKNSWWWTRSVHEGTQVAIQMSKTGDFILTMNNDCYFNKNYISNIVKASITNKRAIVGSLILDEKNPKKVIDAGIKICWPKKLLYGIAPNFSDKISFYTDRKIIDNIDTLPGKGSLIPIEVFKKIGSFKHKLLPHYIADYEFFCRAKTAGFNIIVSANSQLFSYAKETGIEDFDASKIKFSDALRILFSRKSKHNVKDHVLFILLCCPLKYIPRNLWKQLSIFISFFPFVYKTMLFLHNLPIYIRQSHFIVHINLIIHNFLAHLTQKQYLSKTLSRFFLFFEKILFKKISNKYKVIPKRQAQSLLKGWCKNSIPKMQKRVVQPFLKKEIYPPVAKPVVDIIKKINTSHTNILDVGCSTGYYYDFLKFANLTDIKYQGCDISPSFIKLAKKLHPKVKFEIADIAKLPYDNKQFEVVLASAVLYYAKNYKEAIRELARVSSKYIILHRVPIFANDIKTVYIGKITYGIPLPDMIFNNKELNSIFTKNRLSVKRKIKSDSFAIEHLGLGKANQYTILLQKT